MDKLKVGLVLMVMVLTGCTSIAPPYNPSFSRIETLKQANLHKVKLDAVKAADSDIEKVTIRGGTMKSPYQSYANYLGQAITEELKRSNLLDDSAEYTISIDFLKNDIDGSGVSVGTADLSARFIALKAGVVVYDQVHTIHHEWESSFIGAVAIPNTINNYPVAMHKLVGEFLTDEAFLKAIKL